MDSKRAHLKNYIQTLEDIPNNYDSLLEAVKGAECVLIGESTHGTHEFYQIRADITKYLIRKQGFNAIAVEGDWPDTYRINRYVKGDNTIKNSIDALEGFKRFPTWMWRNKVVVEFIDWLYDYNLNIRDPEKVGFYGLDLYSLNASIEAIIKYLEKEDVEAAARAKQRYSCFDPFKEELQHYGFSVVFGMAKSCENAVIDQLADLNKNAYFYLKKNGLKEDEFFHTEQNAHLVKNAEKYYRSMFISSESSWNIRDTHMAETLDRLVNHLTKKLQKRAKMVIWAHNSHIGDARATESGTQGQLNIGQLARERYGNKAALIGFLTNSGTVTAASAWDGVAERKIIRPALQNSYEHFFHNLNIPTFIISFKDNEKINRYIPNNLLERAIGVIYLPKTERTSHYFYANLSKQFDVVIYLDNTTAITPLETTAVWHKGEVFETYPSGL